MSYLVNIYGMFFICVFGILYVKNLLMSKIDFWRIYDFIDNIKEVNVFLV